MEKTNEELNMELYRRIVDEQNDYQNEKKQKRFSPANRLGFILGRDKMTAAEYCRTNPPVAYWYESPDVKIHGIEYGITDYVYLSSVEPGGMCSYHKLKVYEDYKGRSSFVYLHGKKIALGNCIRLGTGVWS